MEVNALEHVKNLGWVAFALSLGTLILGIYSFFKVKKRLKKHYYQKMWDVHRTRPSDLISKTFD